MPKFRIYPTLLNTFSYYLRGKITEQALLDRINRVPAITTEAQQRGVSFEEALIKGTQQDVFDPEILRKARAKLPRPMVDTQVYCQYQIGDVTLYGFVDVIGQRTAVDIKTTAHYTEGRYQFDHQNFYLPALQKRGIREMRYLITDFKDVYEEVYGIETDFQLQLEELYHFKTFLTEHQEQIIDQKIMQV